MRMEITKELLQGYRSKKDEILELDYILKNRWRDEGLIGNDVIFDYSKGYPMPQGVVGFDKEKYDRLQDRDQRRKEQLEQLCKEYEGTIYYDRLILGMWKRAEGAIYKRFADNPDAYRCEVVEELNPDAEVKQFRKEDITSIEIGLDFGGNQSGHSFVARGYTDNYRDVIALKSRRIMAKDENEDIDSNMLDKMFCDFVGEVIEEYGVVIRHGDYVEYCNVETVYYDNAETVLGNSIRNAVEKQYPWISVRKAKKATINDRIRCTVKLMGAGRFFITKDCESLKTAFSDAVWNKDVKDKDDRLDDGSTDIDSLDAFEYTIERDMKYLIEEVEDV